jgi:hypothetical protein
MRVARLVLAGALVVPAAALGASAAEGDLDAALAAHAEELRALRDTSRPFPVAVPDSAALRRTLERAYGPGTAVLLHRFVDGGKALRSWLVRPGAEVVAGTCAHPSKDVAAYLGRLHGGLGVTLAGWGPGAAGRGAEPLVQSARGAPSAKRFEAAVAELSACLFPGEVAAAVSGVRRLVVVPTQYLGIVPYAMLRPGGRAPLVETTAVAIAPSAAAIAALADADDAGPPLRPLVVGDPTPGSALHGAREEARTVAAAWSVEPLVGARATRAEVVRRAEAADVLYFATHGYVTPAGAAGRGAMAAGAVPSPRGIGDRIVLSDEGWTAASIAYSGLRARLAVLSACDTALGAPRAAGVVGMSRAFHLAGVPRVVSSLWNVSDRATAALMVDFAAALATEEPAEALRRAMLAQRARTPDPALWGAFTVFGAPRATFAGIGPGAPDEIAAACRDGCLVVFTPRDGVPRTLCAGDADCAGDYARPGPGPAGSLWLVALRDAAKRREASSAADSNGRSGLTLALVEAWSGGPALLYRRVP